MIRTPLRHALATGLHLIALTWLPAAMFLGTPSPSQAQDPDWNALPVTDHETVQAVDGSGVPAFSQTQCPIKMVGVVINNYDEMLDNTANFIPFTGSYYQLGGQWQVFFQPIEPVDTAGTCMWMGQNYGTAPEHQDDEYSYSNEAWEAELARISWLADPADPDPANPTLPLVQLREGCLVEVHARAGRPYAGKFNVNENHSNSPTTDFDIVILDVDYGMPDAIAITLDDVVNTDGTFLFDSTRQSGAELYQGRRVTIQDVTITDSEDWEKYGQLTVGDGSREFTIKLGYNEAFDTATLPVGPIDVTGVFDQEDFSSPHTGGYRLWATRPDAFSPAGDPTLGDANVDGVVNDLDVSLLAARWQTSSGASWFDADFNDDGTVNDLDVSLLASHWQEGVTEATPVPEPAAAVMLFLGGFAMVMRSLRRKARG